MTKPPQGASTSIPARCLLLVLTAVPLLLIACTDSSSADRAESRKGSAPTTDGGPPLMPIPDEVMRRCQQDPKLAPACPPSLPQVDGEYTGGRAFSAGERGDKGRIASIYYQAAASNRLTRKNSPPRFAHVNVLAGNLKRAFFFRFPRESPSRVDADTIRRYPKKAKLLERQSWNGRTGRLVLAPAFPAGGPDGGHLIFRWKTDGMDFALSLHAWLPLPDAIRTLQAVVEALPP